MFDDVFLNKKTYIILLGNELTDTVKNQFHTAFSGRITLADQQISFVESVLLNDILSCLWLNQIQITDIQIRENSLYDYFKKEVAK